MEDQIRLAAYKNQFDKYSKDPEHTVAVILFTSKDISLQYLSN